MEALWYEAYERSVKHEELKRRCFAQEAIAEGFKYGDEARYAEEAGKLAKLKSLARDAHDAHTAAIAKAQEAQDKLLAVRHKA